MLDLAITLIKVLISLFIIRNIIHIFSLILFLEGSKGGQKLLDIPNSLFALIIKKKLIHL